MTTQTANTSELLRETANAIDAQPMLPRSPGLMIGATPLLCAGAAVVYEAAKKVLDPAALYGLASDMISAGSDGILRKAAELQLDTGLVRLIVLNNDACPDGERHDRMATLLRALAADGERSAASLATG